MKIKRCLLGFFVLFLCHAAASVVWARPAGEVASATSVDPKPCGNPAGVLDNRPDKPRPPVPDDPYIDPPDGPPVSDEAANQNSPQLTDFQIK